MSEYKPITCVENLTAWDDLTKKEMLEYDRISILLTRHPSPSGWIMFEAASRQLGVLFINKIGVMQ
jgi:hypothetical protein